MWKSKNVYQSKRFKECFSELLRHERVDDEIDWGIDESDVVHQVSQGLVALEEEGVVDCRQHAKDSLQKME